MLQVTDPALLLLKDALVNERTQETQVFRLHIQNDEFVLGLGEIEDDDIEFTHNGNTVLATDPELADSVLGDTTIDLETTSEGPKLVLVT